MVLLGPSGCGKSTLLHSIAGLLDVERRESGDRRRRRDLGRSQGPRHRHGVPELRALSDDDGGTQPVVRPAHQRHAQGRHQETRRRRGAHVAPDRAAAAQAGAAFGRSATARGDRSCAGARSQGVPARRTAFQPRRQAAGRVAPRAQAAPSGPGRDHGVCHARPGRGDDTGHAHGGHARRKDPAVRPARAGLCASGQYLRRRIPGVAEHELHPRDSFGWPAGESNSTPPRSSSTSPTMRLRCRQTTPSPLCWVSAPSTCAWCRQTLRTTRGRHWA